MLEIGLYGLGRMGANMARRLSRGGVRVLALNRSPEVAAKLARDEANVIACPDLDDLLAKLPVPRSVWLMLPAGEATDHALAALAARLSPGDLIVDGANGYYKDAQRRALRPFSRRLRRRPTKAGRMSVRSAPGISPRWFTTASSTA
jgi:6-phosphogluconate dehydrogenase